MLAPELGDVLFDGAPGGAVVEESSDSSVDLEGWNEEKATFKCVDEGCTEGFFILSRDFARGTCVCLLLLGCWVGLDWVGLCETIETVMYH